MRPVNSLAAIFALALLAAFGAPPRAVAKALSAQNIVSGAFAENNAAHARLKSPQPLDFAPETATCGYETASGRPKWPSRDPIGERGGQNLYNALANNFQAHIDSLGLYLIKRNCFYTELKTGPIAPREHSVFGKKVSASLRIEATLETCEVCCNEKWERKVTKVGGKATGTLELVGATVGGEIPERFSELFNIEGYYWFGIQGFALIKGSIDLSGERKSCEDSQFCFSVGLSGEAGVRVGGSAWTSLNDTFGKSIFSMELGLFGEGKLVASGWTLSACCPMEGGLSGCTVDFGPGGLHGSFSVTIQSFLASITFGVEIPIISPQ